MMAKTVFASVVLVGALVLAAAAEEHVAPTPEECPTACTLGPQGTSRVAEEKGAEEIDGPGDVAIYGTELEFFRASSGVDQRYVAVQFSRPRVPQGAIIKAATITFIVDKHPNSSELQSLGVRIEAESAASVMASGGAENTLNWKTGFECQMVGTQNCDNQEQDCKLKKQHNKALSTRAASTTGKVVTWSIPAVTSADTIKGNTMATPDVSAVVQSLVDDPAWVYRETPMTFLFSRASGTGTRTFENKNRHKGGYGYPCYPLSPDKQGPTLTIEYTYTGPTTTTTTQTVTSTTTTTTTTTTTHTTTTTTTTTHDCRSPGFDQRATVTGWPQDKRSWCCTEELKGTSACMGVTSTTATTTTTTTATTSTSTTTTTTTGTTTTCAACAVNPLYGFGKAEAGYKGDEKDCPPDVMYEGAFYAAPSSKVGQLEPQYRGDPNVTTARDCAARCAAHGAPCLSFQWRGHDGYQTSGYNKSAFPRCTLFSTHANDPQAVAVPKMCDKWLSSGWQPNWAVYDRLGCGVCRTTTTTTTDPHEVQKVPTAGPDACQHKAREHACHRRVDCFPADAQIEFQNGTFAAMSLLEIGDLVRVGPSQFEPVFMFSHQDFAARSEFVHLSVGQRSLTLTPGHYVYVNGSLATARTVKPFDVVVTVDGPATVTAVARVTRTGLFNLKTASGNIFVDGVKASVYTEAMHPSVAHALLWPAAKLASLGATIPSSFTTTGPADPSGALWLSQDFNGAVGALAKALGLGGKDTY